MINNVYTGYQLGRYQLGKLSFRPSYSVDFMLSYLQQITIRLIAPEKIINNKSSLFIKKPKNSSRKTCLIVL